MDNFNKIETNNELDILFNKSKAIMNGLNKFNFPFYKNDPILRKIPISQFCYELEEVKYNNLLPILLINYENDYNVASIELESLFKFKDQVMDKNNINQQDFVKLTKSLNSLIKKLEKIILLDYIKIHDIFDDDSTENVIKKIQNKFNFEYYDRVMEITSDKKSNKIFTDQNCDKCGIQLQIKENYKMCQECGLITDNDVELNDNYAKDKKSNSLQRNVSTTNQIKEFRNILNSIQGKYIIGDYPGFTKEQFINLIIEVNSSSISSCDYKTFLKKSKDTLKLRTNDHTKITKHYKYYLPNLYKECCKRYGISIEFGHIANNEENKIHIIIGCLAENFKTLISLNELKLNGEANVGKNLSKSFYVKKILVDNLLNEKSTDKERDNVDLLIKFLEEKDASSVEKHEKTWLVVKEKIKEYLKI